MNNLDKDNDSTSQQKEDTVTPLAKFGAAVLGLLGLNSFIDPEAMANASARLAVLDKQRPELGIRQRVCDALADEFPERRILELLEALEPTK